MKILTWFKSLPLDRFLILLILTVIVASILPCSGEGKIIFDGLTTFGIGLLFFMHGAKLDFKTIVEAVFHWRLHCLIFLTTFFVFPLLGFCLQFLPDSILPKNIAIGFLFLCTLPATVQSAIAFTSIAKGNVAAAVCSASASTLLGVIVTPVLITLLMKTEISHSVSLFESIESIIIKLIVPFFSGNIARHWIKNWVHKNKKLINKVDRISILLVVYVAFSDAVVHGIWHQIDLYSFFMIVCFSVILLVMILMFTTYASRFLKFNKADEITIVFCGSKKSLANGIAMASILFPAASVGIILLPLMLFHQIQLMICSYLSMKYVKKSSDR